MLRLALLFLLIAIVAEVLGLNGVAGMTAEVGRLLLFVFLVLAILFFIGNFLRGAPPPTNLP
jgi:uncharacterized membrane protein YtjA (UPF0391 family)